MKTVTLTLKTITPLFMGGANQQAELRTQSFKGLFRYWFRILGGSRAEEKSLYGWGGDNATQSKIKISIKYENNIKNIFKFEKEFDARGYVKQNGYNYITFSLYKRFEKDPNLPGRSYIKEDEIFYITLCFSPLIKDEEIKKILASVWGAFYLGNFGSRLRRGFGSIMVTSIDYSGINENLINFVKWKIDNNNIITWYTNQLEVIKGLFNNEPIKGIPSIKKDFKIYKLNKESLDKIREWITEIQKNRNGRFLANKFTLKKITSRNEILETMGYLLMAYRSYYKHDYDIAKNILENRDKLYNKCCIKRTAFGLPLNFYFSSLKKGAMIEAKNRENNQLRRASPVIFKIIDNSDNNSNNIYEGIFIYQKSLFIPEDVTIKLKNTELSHPDFSIIDEFFNSLLKKNILMEVYSA